MRRRISLLLAAVLAGTTLMLFGPTQPANAVVVCAGQGTATVNPGLLYPILGGITGPGKDHVVDILIGKDNTPSGFSISLDVGVGCTHVAVPPTTGPAAGAGILKGYCGHSSGTGAIGGQQFSYVSVGTFLILTGHVVGVASAIPTPGTGSCAHFEPVTPLPSGATQFLVTGAGVGLNCNNALPAQETLIRIVDQDVLVVVPGTNTPPLPPTPEISLLGVHVHLGVHLYTTPICTEPDVML
jgi:hypothetical protein